MAQKGGKLKRILLILILLILMIIVFILMGGEGLLNKAADWMHHVATKTGDVKQTIEKKAANIEKKAEDVKKTIEK
jgi:hypothetical protein